MIDPFAFDLPEPIGYHRRQWESEEAPEALSTGLPCLDEVLGGGLLPGQVFTVGANTGCGKSSFGVNLACRVAEQGKPAVLFTFEMTVRALAARVNQTYSGVNASKIQTKKLNPAEAACVTEADQFLDGLPLYVTYGSYLSLSNIATVMKRFKDDLGAEIFIFDYIQKMNLGDESSRAFGVENAMQAIRKAAKEVVDLPVCVLSQLGRDAGKRGGEPTVYDMRDTGAVENESDVVMLIDPVEPRPMSGWHSPVPFNFIIAKQREGGGATVPVTFVPHRVRFEDQE